VIGGGGLGNTHDTPFSLWALNQADHSPAVQALGKRDRF
jgi:hypothetical protein